MFQYLFCDNIMDLVTNLDNQKKEKEYLCFVVELLLNQSFFVVFQYLFCDNIIDLVTNLSKQKKDI